MTGRSTSVRAVFAPRVRPVSGRGAVYRSALAMAAALNSGCSQPSESSRAPALAAAKLASRPSVAEQATDFSRIPVPAEGGSKLAPLAMQVFVRSRPESRAEAVGYLRVGARVARSEKPVARGDCPEGWYALRPLGFVCAGPDATVRLEHPIAQAIQVEPDRSKPMPYKYAFVRAIAPNYLHIPTKEEQFTYEMRLERHLRNWNKLQREWDALDVGANDVPLDPHGAGVGGIPEHALPMSVSQRFGGNGDDRVPGWLSGGRQIPNLSTFHAPSRAVIADRVKRHAGIALIGTFVADATAQDRRFAVSTDARLLPADKLKADSGSPFHGQRLENVGLPVAFAYAEGATWWDLSHGNLERGKALQRREFITLSGAIKEIGGVRMVEGRNGGWLRSDDLRTIAKPSHLPPWARGGTKWIDVSIIAQTMVLWEGDRPVYATLISTGRDGLGEPGKTLSTPRGVYRILQKHITTTMDSEVADKEFELRDVPWVMYFKGGYALHGTYWHDDFGRGRSHGCINLSPVDARYTFMWSSPEVPLHWHAAYSGESFGQGTLIQIHP